jgi:ubiquinone/menaquinone biosynthesis C-methylase UbiE
MGTGHGDWAYEVASTYPNARVIGLDLNPPSTPVTIQKNLIFKIQDIRESWDIRDNSVDL